MRSLVYLEILRPGEDFAAIGKWTRERFLSGVHSYVIHEFVLGLEGLTVTRATLPEARVRCALGSAHVVHCQVRHNVVKVIEDLATEFSSVFWRHQVLVYPHAGNLLKWAAASDGARVAAARAAGAVRPHESEEGAVMTRMVHSWVLLVVDGRRRHVRRTDVLVMRR